MSISNYIQVYKFLNSPFAISTEEGETIFNEINRRLLNNENVTLDFENIHLVVSTFLNASIGQLYGLYDPSFIKDHLNVVNMSIDDLNILKIVIDRAKEYFKDKNGFEDTMNQHFPNA